MQIGDSTSFPSGETIYVWGAQMVLGSSADALMVTSDTTTSVLNGQTVYLAANGMNQGYSYDGFGNTQQSGNFNFTQAYTSANQLAGWNYDASGNLLSDAYSNTYTYDSEGQNTGVRLSSGGTASYIYDAAGQRIEKDYGSAVTDTIFFGGEPLARYSGGAWTDLIYGPSGLLAEVPGTQNGAPVYRMLDHLGTQVGTLSSTGVLLSASDYEPFGQTFQGGTPDPYQFTGKERDTESGLDYFGARYYSSNMGRFMSPDWAAQEEPVPYAVLDDPQSLNLYAYVRNNPLSRVDADGHTCNEYLHFANLCDPQPPSLSSTAMELTAAAGVAANTPKAQQTNRQPDGSYKATPAQLAELRAKAKNKEHVYSPSDPANGPNSGQCVTACEHFTGVPGPTSSWRFGKAATDLTDDDIGTAIATRVGSGSDARYGGNAKNSGVFMGRGVGGIYFADQWPKLDGNQPVRIWFMQTNDPRNPDNSAMNASSYGVIIAK